MKKLFYLTMSLILATFFTKVAKCYCSNIVGIALTAYDWANCMNLFLIKNISYG